MTEDKIKAKNDRISSNYSQADGHEYFYVDLGTFDIRKEAEQKLQQILKNDEIVERLKEIDMDILQDSVKEFLKNCDKDFEASGHDGTTAQAYFLVNQIMEKLVTLQSLLK